MQMRMRVAQFRHQANIALHEARFGLRRHAAQPQLERHRAQVHARALRHARVFSVLDHAQAHARRRGQRFAHDAVFQNRDGRHR